MNWINSWKSGAKQKDKFDLKLRLGKFTLIEISYDKSKKDWRVMLLNFGFQTKSKKKLLKG